MRITKERLIGGCLELFAIALANWQALAGVRTDEAKYLLNIPYPHPPLLRWILSMTEVLPYQDMLWRLLLATLMVQAVWLVWDMTRNFHLEDRIMVCAGWLLSSAVIVQAGSIVLAPAVALEVLVLVWLRSRPEFLAETAGDAQARMRKAALIGLFWLGTVFTGFQSVLFFPLAWSVLRRLGCGRKEVALYVVGPVILLILWTLSNPLAIATMVIHSSDGARVALAERLIGSAKLWLVGGAGVVSVVGTFGIFQSRNWPLIISFLLVVAYVTASVPYPFYAILFTPLFVAGLWSLFSGRRHPHAFPLLACLLFAGSIVVWFNQPARTPGPETAVMQAIASGSGASEGVVMISGSFGHQWQYASRFDVRRYVPERVGEARAIVCLSACEPMFNTSDWKRLPDLSVETWVRKL